MKYITEFTLTYCKDAGYDDMNKSDIVPAKYWEGVVSDSNPDNCAIPPMLAPDALEKENTIIPVAFTRTSVEKMSQSERLELLETFKDRIKITMPVQYELECKIRSCLNSAYSHREYAIAPADVFTLKAGEDTGMKENESLSSVNRYPYNSVQDICLYGAPGDGKTTAVGLALRKIPRGIRHKLGGYSYTQIPYLWMAMGGESDRKSIFLGLISQIDDIVNAGGAIRNSINRKNSKDEIKQKFMALCRQYHVGLIVIDEIQHINIDLFKDLLGITESIKISVCIIGTDKVINFFSKEYWFERRFKQRAKICSTPKANDDAIADAAEMLLKIQISKTKYPVMESMKQALVTECMGNMDFLTTIYVTAQYLVISTEDRKNPVPFDADTIKKAASMYPEAKAAISGVLDSMEDALKNARQASELCVRTAKEEAQIKETKSKMKNARKGLLTDLDILPQIIISIQATTEISEKKIKAAYYALQEEGTDFESMKASQRNKFVLTRLLQKEAVKDAKKAEREAKKKSETENPPAEKIIQAQVETRNRRVERKIERGEKRKLQAEAISQVLFFDNPALDSVL